MIKVNAVSGSVFIINNNDWIKLQEELNNQGTNPIMLTDGVYEYLICRNFNFAFARNIKNI
jgi:hypothetical protein